MAVSSSRYFWGSLSRGLDCHRRSNKTCEVRVPGRRGVMPDDNSGEARLIPVLHGALACGGLRFKSTVTRLTYCFIETSSTRYHGPLVRTVHSIAVDGTSHSPASSSNVRFCSILRRFLMS